VVVVSWRGLAGYGGAEISSTGSPTLLSIGGICRTQTTDRTPPGARLDRLPFRA